MTCNHASFTLTLCEDNLASLSLPSEFGLVCCVRSVVFLLALWRQFVVAFLVDQFEDDV